MDFDRKYALLDPVPGQGTRSFQARQVSTGRDVTVHLLEPGETPESEAVLGRLRNLPPQSMSKLIEVGDHEGTRYVVTVAPPYLHLDEWLAEQERAAPAPDARQFTRAGAWKVPVARPEPSVAQPEPPAARESAPAAPAPPAATAHEPGEFTRMFKSPPAASTGQMPVSMPISIPVSIPVTPEAVNPPAVPPPAAASAGEFTRLFQSPHAAAQDEWPLAQPKSPQSGEFTKMFQSPAPAARPAPESAPQQGGEFTRFFQSPPPGTAQGPQLPSASAFPAAAPPPTPSAPPAWPPGGGSATQAFSLPASAPPSPLPSAPQGPSEYTRMMSAQPNLGAVPQMPHAGFPQIPGLPSGMPQANFPQAPVMQVPQPVIPQPIMPQPPVVQAPGNNLLLIGIFVLLAFLAGGLIVLLLVRR